ncbi:MAG: hypothetical protein FD133_1791 [Erysipelotrichaceae bacterium]|nr:MAG: hypothetical protein FD133_1791 [Erysipelotrichaceae bacterium]
MNINFDKIWPYLPQFGQGVLVTLQLAALSAMTRFTCQMVG